MHFQFSSYLADPSYIDSTTESGKVYSAAAKANACYD